MTELQVKVDRLLLGLRALREENDQLRASMREPIAVVGLGMRLPGAGATFWQTVAQGLDASREVPANRWDANAYYDPDPSAHNKTTTKRGSFLDQDLHAFDASFFSIAPVEATVMDPHQRLLLEVVWEALEDSGLPASRLRGGNTGVFVGMSANDYGVLYPPEKLSADAVPYCVTGSTHAVVAGRVSYVLGLMGPSLVVDTACSSSFVALHLACQSLRDRDCDIALTGGVNLMLSPSTTVGLSKLGALSPDGRCKTFDASGNGYGRGEGCGIVVLKRLSDALRAGDRICAVIRGSAINQDGASDGLTAPNGLAQQQVIRSALEFAKISPGEVQYVEAHGTGTVLGDPIEIEALVEVFADAHAQSPLAIGSVKTNIGHLEAAAGIASLIKTLLAIRHRQLPPSLHFKTPNPHIPWGDIPIRVQTQLGPWPEPSKPLIAGISSYGASGTNAHIVVSEPPPELDAWKDADVLAEQAMLLPLALSAKSPEALRAYAERFAEYLEQPLEPPFTWRDVAFTSCVRRSHLDHRLLVAGSSVAEWAERLRAFAKGDSPKGLVVGHATESRGRIVFAFSGQGSQWWGMGRELLEKEPIFRAAVEKCAQFVDRQTKWKLLEELGRDEASSRLGETEIAQPALFALQVGLCEVWKSWGVEPQAVVGHSLGEITAAYVAGALTLEGAIRLVVERGRVLQKATGRGKMASVELGAAEAEELVRDFPGLEVGGSNGPRSTTLSGEAKALESALQMLRARGVECKELRVNYAFHSAQLDELAQELTGALKGLEASVPKLRMVSTVTGEVAPKLDAKYWGGQVRNRVRFYEATKTLIAEGNDVFVEVGPHPVLLPAIDETLEELGKKATLVKSLKRKEPERETMREALGALHCAGYPVDWDKQYPVRGRVAPLPTYPWQWQRYWLPVPKTAERHASPWPLIHTHVSSSDLPGKHIFELELDLKDESLAYLSDHKIQGVVWLPGAAYVEMALEAANAVFANRSVGIEQLTLAQALTVNETEPVLVQLVLHPEREGASPFTVTSRPARDATEPWTVHASGQLRLEPSSPASPSAPLKELQARCTEASSADALYDSFATAGLQYGPAFQGIEQVWASPSEALAKLTLVGKFAGPYVVHPALLDAAFQTGAAAVRRVAAGETFVPASVQRLRVRGKMAKACWAHASVRSVSSSGIELDVRILDEAGQLLVEVEGLRALPLGRATDRLDSSVFETQWRTVSSDKPESVQGTWLLLADREGIGEALRTWLEARGARVVSVSSGSGFTQHDATHVALDPLQPDPFRRLLKEKFGSSPPKHIVHLWSLEGRTPEAELTESRLARASELSCSTTLHLVQAIAQMGWGDPPRLFLVTRGCQPATGSRDVVLPEQALLWGFGATIVNEFSELRTTLIDLDPQSPSADALAHELAHADREDRIALRGSERRVPRLVRHTRPARAPGALRPLSVGTEAYRLGLLHPGQLDSLTLEPCPVPKAGPGEIVIRTRATGLNFRDVLMALGLYPGLGDERPPMGSECAGVVAAVGDGVDNLRLGDEVMASADHAFDAFVTAPAALVVKKPSSLSFEQAAALPAVMMTVLYALGHIGRMKKAERILIHAATGGVGLAALHYAKYVGAEIFATAGSEEKRAYLRSLGIEHVYDSRSLAWAEGILRDTEGRGVDIVLNSLAGEAIAKGLGVLAPFGRFLELGKRDIYADSSLGMYALRNNITVSAVALDQLGAQRPNEARALLVEAVRLIEQGALPPLPVEAFPISRAADAFQYLARAQHMGKVVLVSQDAVTVRDSARSELVHPGKTYLITGGLGGLGLVVAKRLTRLGATHLALMGRRAPSDSAKSLIRELEQAGAHVHILSADVGDRASLERALKDLQRSAPPIAGIVHTAGVLDDGTLLNLAVDRIAPVLVPKVLGTVLLETLLPEVDSFVLFSSVAGLLGSAGQANYSAANAFLDAFAHHRARADKHALSFDWTAWADVGILAARPERIDNMARQGVSALSSEEGAEIFERLLPSSSRQLVAFPVDVHQWRQANPHVASLPLLTELFAMSTRTTSRTQSALVDRLHAASETDRLVLLDGYLRSAIAHIIRSSPEAIPLGAPLKQLGFDSLLTVSLKNTLERDLNFRISTANLFAHPTLEQLIVFAASKLPSQQTAAAPTRLEAGRENSTSKAPVTPEHLPDTGSDPSVEDLRKLIYGI